MFEAAPHPDLLRYAVAAIAVAAAALFLLIDRLGQRRALRAARWPVAPGIVTSSGIVRRWGFGSGVWMAGLWYVPEVAYRYEVDGRKYAARRVFLTDTGFSRRRKAQEVVARYPRGTGVAVHYDPARPKRACLEPVQRESRALGAAGLLGAVAIAALAMD
jgi:hypothetical protein